MILELAVLKNFNSGTYKAAVQLAGSLTTYFDDVPVSRAIPTSALVIGNRVILAIPGDNPRDACVIATWPQGSPGGAEVHGNEYHDPDFASLADLASHAAAATGVHNVGSLYIAKSSVDGLNLASHKTRHQSGGADEISLADLKGVPISCLPTPDGKNLLWEMFKSMDGWTTSCTGTGSIGPTFCLVQFYTGTTASSLASIYITGNPFQYPSYNGQRCILKVQSATNLTNSIIRLYLTRAAISLPPSDTSKHGGLKIINGEIWASNGDGTAETSTDTGCSIATVWRGACLEVRGTGSSIQFYVDNILRATHTTNLYTDGNGRLWIGITNTDTIDQGFLIRPLAVMGF